jgi:hypothetical protein
LNNSLAESRASYTQIERITVTTLEIEPEELIQSVPSAVGRVCEDYRLSAERQTCGNTLYCGEMPLRNEVDIGRDKPVKAVNIRVREYYFEETDRIHIMVDVWVGFKRRQRWVANYVKLKTFLSTLRSVLEDCRARKESTLSVHLRRLGLTRPR